MPAQGADPGGVEARLRDQGLGRVEPGDLVGQLGPRDAREHELAGRELDPGQAELAADLDDGGEEVGGLRVEQPVVGQRAGGDDADDLALDQPLGELRVLDLLADRRTLAGLDELGQVRIERGWGKPAIGMAFGPLSRVVSARPSRAAPRSASSPNIS